MASTPKSQQSKAAPSSGVKPSGDAKLAASSCCKLDLKKSFDTLDPKIKHQDATICSTKVSFFLDFMPMILVTALFTYMIQSDFLTEVVLPKVTDVVQKHFGKFFEQAGGIEQATFLLQWKLVYALLFVFGLFSVVFYSRVDKRACFACGLPIDHFFSLSLLVAFQSQLPLKFVFQWTFLYVAMSFFRCFARCRVFSQFAQFGALGFASILFLGSVLEHDFVSRLTRFDQIQKTAETLRIVAQDILVEYFPQVAF